jgi:predicted  nucleic acid-binding Zn-ribbon protein
LNLPADDEKSMEEEKSKLVDDGFPPDQNDCGAASVVVQVGMSEGHPDSNPSEEMTLMLKQLLEKVQQNDGRHVTKEILSELQNASNTKLEQRNERLQAELKHAAELWRSEKESFLVKTTRLEADLESAQNQIQALPKLEQKLYETQQEKSQQLLQIQSLQEKLASSEGHMHRHKAQLASLREHNQAELRQLSESNQALMQTQLDLKSELQKTVQARKELVGKVDEYEQTITEQEAMLKEGKDQLARVKELLQSKEETLLSIRKQLTGHESTIVELKDQIEKLQQTCHNLRDTVSTQQVESQTQLKSVTSQVEAKNTMIGDLFRQLGEKENEISSLNGQWERAKEEFAQVEEKQAAHIAELDQALEQTMAQMDEYEVVKKDLLMKLREAEKGLKDQLLIVENHALQCKSLKSDLQTARSNLHQAEIDRDRAQLMLEEQLKDKAKKSDSLHCVQESIKAMEVRFKDRETSQLQHISTLEQENRELKRRLKESEVERDEARSNMLGFSDREAELYRKLQESDRLRRDLHSRVMQLTGNIRVYVRVRPLLPVENAREGLSMSGKDPKKRGREDEETPFSFPGVYDRNCKSSRSYRPDDVGKNVIIATEPYKDRGGLSDRRKTWKFRFDNVFSPHHGQEDVWEATLPLIQSAVDGYNVTIFAYGQTSSGKTYTMLGDETSPGIVSRAVEKLFQSKREIEELSRGDATVQMSVELLEIYNERINDLLDPESPVNRNDHSIKVVSKEVVGNVVVQTSSDSEVMELVALAQDRRCVKATASNTESSRSHMIFSINFCVTMNDGSTRSGKLNVCDLAGSERLGKSGTHLVGVSLSFASRGVDRSALHEDSLTVIVA